MEFAKYWMHNAFLNINNKKMSKSSGNFFTVREIGEKYDLQVLRFFMLSAHYRSPLNFSENLMEAAKNSLERIVTAAENLKHLQENAAGGETSGQESQWLKEAQGYREKFEAAMEDDFNTADAVSSVFELVKFINTKVSSESSRAFLEKLSDLLRELCDVLGIILDKEADILEEEIENLMKERQAARKEKNFKRADEIRDLLLEKGIVLKDTREGVQWKRA